MIKEKVINESVKKKLTSLIFINTFIIMGIMTVFFIVNEIYFIRNNVFQEVSILLIHSSMFFIFCITAFFLSSRLQKIIFTELQKYIDRLKTAKHAAESANTAKSQFLVNMSCGIRTPINDFLSISELLLTTDLTDRQKNLLRTIKLSGENLLRIINNISDFSKIEAGKLVLIKQDFNIHEMFKNTLAFFMEDAQKKNLNLSYIIHHKIPQIICGDQDRLQQILMNLITNAIKFTNKGEITASLDIVEKKDDLITLKFEIKDTGIGISKEIQENIFTPFFQANNSLSRDYQGTGLGLFIASQLVEMMDGSIDVKSEQGKGSNFCFTICFDNTSCTPSLISETKENLPDKILTEKKETITALNSEAKKQHKTKDCILYHILLAEDNIVNQLVAKGILESLKCNVEIACDGIEAFELFKKYSYDLIFMDCQMPKMDGYNATKEIRTFEKKHSYSKQIPIVALTAHALPSEREKCLAAGMDDFITKPFELEELKKVIQKWVPENNVSVDINVLNNIRALQKNGKSFLLEKVIQNYLTNTPKLLNDLEIAVNESSLEQIENIAHSLKSSSGTLGAMPLFKMLKTVEAMAKQKKLDQIRSLYLQIIEEYKKVEQFLSKEAPNGT